MQSRQETGPKAEKREKTEWATRLGRIAREPLERWNQMTALRFQTLMGRHQKSPASLLAFSGSAVLKRRRAGNTQWSHPDNSRRILTKHFVCGKNTMLLGSERWRPTGGAVAAGCRVTAGERLLCHYGYSQLLCNYCLFLEGFPPRQPHRVTSGLPACFNTTHN